MYTKLLTVLFLATFSTIAAGAEPVHKQYKSCVDTCHIEHMACQFNNDLDSCQSSATQCSQRCDRRYPAVAICLNNCEGEWTFCRQDGYSMQSVCRLERSTCNHRCEIPSTISQAGR